MIPRRRSLSLAFLLVLALPAGATTPETGGTVISATVAGRADLVPAPRASLPFGLVVHATRPLEPAPLSRVEVCNGRLEVTPAGHLPPGVLAALLLAPPREASPRPVFLLSMPGRLGVLPARNDGTWAPEDFVPLVEDSRLAAHELSRPDLDGDGTADLVVTSWAGALLLRGLGGTRWSRLGWLPLPRFAGLAPGAVFVRARSPLLPGGNVPRRLWAMDRVTGTVLTFRGTPLTEVRPAPPSTPPPLVARVRLPREPDGTGETIVLPGDPDRAIRLDVERTWKGTRRNPRLLVLPLVPREEGLPADPEMVRPVPLDPGEQPPVLRIEDADGDGTGDILLAGKPRGGKRWIAVVVFRGTGGGRFADVPLVFRGRAGKDALLLSVRDLDGDGRLDLLAAARGRLLLWKGAPPRPGALPWSGAPGVRWKAPPGAGHLSPPVCLFSTTGGRWLLLRHLVADATETRLLAFPLP